MKSISERLVSYIRHWVSYRQPEILWFEVHHVSIRFTASTEAGCKVVVFDNNPSCKVDVLVTHRAFWWENGVHAVGLDDCQTLDDGHKVRNGAALAYTSNIPEYDTGSQIFHAQVCGYW